MERKLSFEVGRGWFAVASSSTAKRLMPSPQNSRIKPPALRPGDTIAIVAPASNIKRAELDAGCEALRSAGYKPIFLDSILEKDLYFAGSADRRASELTEMFTRDDVRAIVCARGGYGTNYLLPRLDLEKIKANPKIFVGYSDATALLTYFADAAGLVTFHGPMATKDWAHKGGVDLSSWQSALTQGEPWDAAPGSGTGGMVDGEATGILYGGCLSILVASLGTPFEIQTKGTILFLEDVAAKPFQIDRMLMQLKLAGKLTEVKGIVFGEMLDCAQTVNQGYTLQEVVQRIVKHLDVPVAYGLRSGHVSTSNITLPIGVQARLQVSDSNVSLKILETSVSA
jgi:muramoyltetrapeptide carboxypeptidase